MLWPKAIIDADYDEAKFTTQQARQQILALQISNAPATAVDHDIQWSASLFGCVGPNCYLLAITHRNLAILLFLHAGDRAVILRKFRSEVFLSGAEEVTERFNICKSTNVEGLASHGLDHLYRMSMGLPDNGGIGDVLPHPILGWNRSANASLECQPCPDAQNWIYK